MPITTKTIAPLIQNAGNKPDYFGHVVFSLHLKNKTIFVYHTAMFRLGFTARNGHAKGFGNLIEIHRRPATENDDAYFLGGTRARWQVYDNVTGLLEDEQNYYPEGVDALKQALVGCKLLSDSMIKTLKTLSHEKTQANPT